MEWARSRVSRWMDGMVMDGMGMIAEVIGLKCRKEGGGGTEGVFEERVGWMIERDKMG